MSKHTLLKGLAAASLLLAVGTLAPVPAFALATYSQGFEQDANGWFSSNPDTVGNPPLARVEGGSGELRLPASSGDYYAEGRNKADEFQPPGGPNAPDPRDFGGAGFSVFGGLSQYPGSPFTQSIDVYLNTSWGGVENGQFSVDMIAANSAGTNYNYNTEHRFNIASPASDDNVTISSKGNRLATVNQSGWYTFRTEYARADERSKPSTATLRLLNAAGRELGSRVYDNCVVDGDGCTSADLGGTGLVSINAWRVGFADDIVGIDNIESDIVGDSGSGTVSVPEPEPLWLLGFAALAAALGCARRRRRSDGPVRA